MLICLFYADVNVILLQKFFFIVFYTLLFYTSSLSVHNCPKTFIYHQEFCNAK